MNKIMILAGLMMLAQSSFAEKNAQEVFADKVALEQALKRSKQSLSDIYLTVPEVQSSLSDFNSEMKQPLIEKLAEVLKTIKPALTDNPFAKEVAFSNGALLKINEKVDLNFGVNAYRSYTLFVSDDKIGATCKVEMNVFDEYLVIDGPFLFADRLGMVDRYFFYDSGDAQIKRGRAARIQTDCYSQKYPDAPQKQYKEFAYDELGSKVIVDDRGKIQ